MPEPTRIETYLGYEIWFDPKTERFFTPSQPPFDNPVMGLGSMAPLKSQIETIVAYGTPVSERVQLLVFNKQRWQYDYNDEHQSLLSSASYSKEGGVKIGNEWFLCLPSGDIQRLRDTYIVFTIWSEEKEADLQRMIEMDAERLRKVQELDREQGDLEMLFLEFMKP